MTPVPPEPAGVAAFIGLGANLGDPRSTLTEAIDAMAALPSTKLVARSSFWRTAPVDASGPDFINAVIELRTALGPFGLLHAMQAIEQRHGRLRLHHNAPRTLDLDLLLYGSRVIASRELTLPHPRMHQRAFVLAPLAELAPSLLIPGHGSVSGLLGGITDQLIERLA